MRLSNVFVKAVGLALVATLLVVVLVPTQHTAAALAPNVWRVDYYGNMELEPPIIWTQTITFPYPYLEMDWPWGMGPAHDVPDDFWSARFTTNHYFEGGNVKFMLNSDDGSRLYVNGALIIDAWKDRAATWYETRVLYVPPGTYTIVVEYFDHAGTNSMTVRFEPTEDEPAAGDTEFVFPGQSGGGPMPSSAGPALPPSVECPPGCAPTGGTSAPPAPTTGGDTAMPAPVPPEGGIVVDQGDKAFTWSGSDDWAFEFGGAIDGVYVHTPNSEFGLRMWGRWNSLFRQTGYYDVYVYVPAHFNATTNARYRVFHGGTLSPVVTVSQVDNPNTWVWLGTFWFRAGGSQYVYLNDLTFESGGSRDVLYDAVQFVFNRAE